MSSLRARLALSVVVVLGLTLSLFTVALSVAFRRALTEAFDARLNDDARALAGMVEEHPDAAWEFEGGGLEAFSPGRDAAYFELWLGDGQVLRSPSLVGADLPMNAEQPRLTLRDGRPGRVRVGTWAPRMSEDDPGAVASGRLVHVAVARSTEGIDATLGLLDQLLAFGGVTALGFAGIAAWFAVRRGLRPLARVVGRLDAIDATRLTERMSSEGVPDELRVAVETVNGLLARLEQSFSRARAFNADVSHELRTPLSGLKAILEVTASKDRDGPAYRTALSQALSVVSQLEGLVENLLLLSRVDAGQLEARREPVSLRSFVDDCWAPHAARAEAKRLTFTNQVAEDASMLTDRARLRMIIGNLLGNAVAYTEPGGAIVVDTVGAVVRVKDSGPLVPAADLERIFLPFVRLDPSRTGTEAHSGIGLALVRALCGSLSLEVAARHADGWLAFEVTHRTS